MCGEPPIGDEKNSAFVAEVIDVIPVAEFKGEALRVNVDPRWVIVVKESDKALGGEEKTRAFAIHSIGESFGGLRAEDVKGKRFAFRLVKRNVAGSEVTYSLEIKIPADG
jgi:hypothetical protein